MGFKKYRPEETQNIPLTLRTGEDAEVVLSAIVTDTDTVDLINISENGIEAVSGARERLEDEGFNVDHLEWTDDGEIIVRYLSDSPEEAQDEEENETESKEDNEEEES